MKITLRFESKHLELQVLVRYPTAADATALTTSDSGGDYSCL